MSEWISCSDVLPPEAIPVMTKIDDYKGVRNEQPLKRMGRLWFLPDDSMYVYYEPTHWRTEESNPMTDRNGKVQLVLQGGGVDVRPMDTSFGLFLWLRDPKTNDVLGMWGQDVHSADDVRKHIADARARMRCNS